MKNNVEITQSQQTSTVDLSADVDFTLDGKPGDVADFSEVLRSVILARCAGQVKLPVGRYNVRLLAIITQDE